MPDAFVIVLPSFRLTGSLFSLLPPAVPQLAVVSQDCVLFARSIRENITYGLEEADEEEIHRAAKLASAHEFITNLPNGYDTGETRAAGFFITGVSLETDRFPPGTDTGERGGQVSGGQKQRIAIARALIRRPTLLVLDCATSDLDSKTESLVGRWSACSSSCPSFRFQDSSPDVFVQVNQALFQHINCTVLLISRNMSVVEKADHIVVLGDGTVKEEGSHAELMANGSLYTELVKSENKSFRRQGIEDNGAD